MVSRHSGLWWIVGLRKDYGSEAFWIVVDCRPQEELWFPGIPDRGKDWPQEGLWL